MQIKDTNLLVDLIKCKTITPTNDGILELLTQFLTNLGFVTEIIEFTEENTYPVKNLYAKLGEGTNCLAFCGHLDVVPEGDIKSWTNHPFKGAIVNNTIIGRGAEDMKGGIASFISAISNIVSQFNTTNNSIVLLLTLDEESLAINGISKLIKHVINNKKDPIKECLLGEPTCINYVGDCIKIGRRGSLNFNITILGKQGHVAYKVLFINPIQTTNSIIAELLQLKLNKELPHFENTNLEITGIYSSSKVYNIVPKEINIIGNIRFNPSYSLEELKELLNKIISPYSYTTINFIEDASSPFITKPDSNIYLHLKNAITKVTNKEPSCNTFGGTSDARFIKDYIPVIEFGLLEKTLHQANERVKIDELNTLTNIYTIFLKNYFAIKN